jgi:hypothetical protein
MTPVGVGDLERGAPRGRGRTFPWIWSPEIDPFREIVQHGGWESARGRHLVRLVPQRGHQQAFRRLSGHNRRPTFATCQQARLRIEKQPRLQFPLGGRRGGMALVAVLDEHRTNGRFKQR